MEHSNFGEKQTDIVILRGLCDSIIDTTKKLHHDILQILLMLTVFFFGP